MRILRYNLRSLWVDAFALFVILSVVTALIDTLASGADQAGLLGPFVISRASLGIHWVVVSGTALVFCFLLFDGRLSSIRILVIYCVYQVVLKIVEGVLVLADTRYRDAFSTRFGAVFDSLGVESVAGSGFWVAYAGNILGRIVLYSCFAVALYRLWRNPKRLDELFDARGHE
jgi:hypothetical protein